MGCIGYCCETIGLTGGIPNRSKPGSGSDHPLAGRAFRKVRGFMALGWAKGSGVALIVGPRTQVKSRLHGVWLNPTIASSVS